MYDTSLRLSTEHFFSLLHSNLLINGGPGVDSDLELKEDHLQVPQQESARSVDNNIIDTVLIAL